MSVRDDPSVWTGGAVQAEYELMEGVGLAHLYPALERDMSAVHLSYKVVSARDDHSGLSRE